MSNVTLESQVYLGLWTNWSRGAVLGRTLTLSRRDGNLLIAFTASFIALITARFWRILCFVSHRYFSSPDPRSSLHRQRQVVLRNSSSPEAAAWSLLQIGHASWRAVRRRRVLAYTVPILVLAVVVWAAFTVAAGFSSTIASAVGDTVLLRSEQCGVTNWTNLLDTSTDAYLSRSIAESELMSNAANYARQCYSSDASGLLDCSRFAQRRLSWQIDTNASCPVDESMCRRNQGNLRLDTGLINTDEALGLNAPPISVGNTTMVRYHYGSMQRSGAPPIDYAYEQRSIDDQYELYTETYSPKTTVYGLDLILSRTADNKPYEGANNLIPIRHLLTPNSDLSILFLSGNGILYMENFDDDWYRGTQLFGNATDGQSIIPIYMPQEAASPLVCTHQYQFCNLAKPGESGCGPLAGSIDAVERASPLFNATIEEIDSYTAPIGNADAVRFWHLWMISRVNVIDPQEIISVLGSNILTSLNSLLTGYQLAPTVDQSRQWQSDVENWFATLMAVLQAAFAFAPLGPDPSRIMETDYADANPTVDKLCKSQKIRSSRYTSFSFFGLCFTYAVGACIILISLILEPLLDFAFANIKGTSKSSGLPTIYCNC
ncbi:hypothetical protein B0I35DRAFT_465311, partial [Stachybotrys elegans]